MLRDLYANFNARDIEAVLEHLTEDVDWANGMTGGRVHGRDAVREYWTAQFTQIDGRVEAGEDPEPGGGAVREYWTAQFTKIEGRVEPVEITELADGRVVVDVHQVVRTPSGEL